MNQARKILAALRAATVHRVPAVGLVAFGGHFGSEPQGNHKQRLLPVGSNDQQVSAIAEHRQAQQALAA